MATVEVVKVKPKLLQVWLNEMKSFIVFEVKFLTKVSTPSPYKYTCIARAKKALQERNVVG